MQMTKARLIRILWLLLLAAWVAVLIFPVRSGIVRLFLLVAPLLLFGALCVAKPRARWGLIPLGLVGLFLVLPGRAVDEEHLRARFCDELLGFEGVTYVWGGEHQLGIDCSGLIRQAMVRARLGEGMRTFNPGLCRDAAELWFRDCSASAMMGEYRGWFVEQFKAESINRIDPKRLQPGDLGVTENGVHVMAYLGENRWIAFRARRIGALTRCWT